MSVFAPTAEEHEPTPAQRRQVEALAGYGFAEADIATVMALKPETLRLHYPASSAPLTSRPMPR